MKYKVLKGFRIAVSIFMILSVTFVFLDLWDLYPRELGKIVIGIQYAPALFTTFIVTGWTTIAFVGITLITLLVGRVYCSHICPMGIFQDIVSFIRKKTTRKKVLFKPRKAKNYWRFGIFAVTFVCFVAGFSLFMNLLEPYSNYGKIVSNLFRPAFYQLNNVASGWLSAHGNFSLFHISFGTISWISVIYSLVFLATVVTLSFLHGRLFCNLICPVGSWLGLLSKVSLFKIQFNESKCINCAKCSLACKSECIDVKNKQVDFSRCVGCFNCMTKCDSKAIGYKLSLPVKKKEEKNEAKAENKGENSRRDFFKKSMATIAGTVVAVELSKASNGNKSDSKVNNNRHFPVTPPGSQSMAHFNEHCTACHLCVSACPTGVLRPSTFEYGLAGLMQPRMDFNSSFCNYECTHCSTTCPVGAILPLTHEEKKLTQIGFVRFEINNCVVNIDGTSCGACAEHCPTSAVKMVPYKNGLTIPSVDTHICVGCGACEHACPARPYKAIWVEGNPIHQKASLPKQESLETEVQEEFPF
jgi:ferredoxin